MKEEADEPGEGHMYSIPVIIQDNVWAGSGTIIVPAAFRSEIMSIVDSFYKQ